MVAPPVLYPVILGAAGTQTRQLTLANVINDAYRAVGTQGDGLSNDGSTGIWPAATNLCTNGGFTTDATGYISSGTNTTTRSTTRAKFGAASGLCTFTVGGGASCAVYGITLTAAAYIGTMWVYVPTAYDGQQLQVAFSNFAGDTNGPTNVNMAVRDQWQKVTATTTPVGGDLVGDFRLSETGSKPTSGHEQVWVDGVQIEIGSVATPYIETDGGTAARSAGRVIQPIDPGMVTGRQGWFATRVREGYASASIPATNAYYALWGDSTTNLISMYASATQVILANGATGGAATDTVAQNKTWALGADVTVIGAWVAGNLYISADGAAYTALGSRAEIPAIAATSMDWGSGGTVVASKEQAADSRWSIVGNGAPPSPTAINSFGNTKPTIRALDQVARGARAMAVWSGRDGTFQRRIGA